MRILHISSEKSWRGGENQIAYLIGENHDTAIENVVLCRKGSVFEQYCRKNGIPYYAGSFTWPGILINAVRLLQLSREFDIVHAHTAKAHLLTHLSQMMGMKSPVLVARRVEFVPHDSYFTRKRYEHPNVVRIICVAEKIREVMRNYLHTGKDRCITIHSGIDLSRFDGIPGASIREEFGIADHAYLIGITSALASEKGHDTFLKVAANILKITGNVHFLIVGSGATEQAVRDLAVSLDISGNVTFTGFRKDVDQILPQLDLFLITSDQEGLSNAVLEAFASNVPVVGTRAGGIPEMVIPNETGLLAEPGDVHSLTEHVKYMMSNPEEARIMASKGALKAIEFSKQRTAEKTYSLYKEVFSDSHQDDPGIPQEPSGNTVPSS